MSFKLFEDSKNITEEAKRVISEEISSLEKFKERINGRFFDAVILIRKARKIITSGIGKSGIIAEKIAAVFSSLGKPAFFLHPVESLHGDIGIVEEDDVVILLSKSGSTEEIVRLLPYLKGRMAKTIALVGNMNSYLSRNADISIDCSVSREACYLDLAPTSSSMVTLAAGDALASCYMKITGLTIEDFSRQHPLGQIGRNITLQVKDVMHKNESLPVINENASFKEAIIEISNKGLGCVVIVDSLNKIKGIITDGDVRRALQKHDNIGLLKAVDAMTHSPVTIEEDTFLGDALALMEQRVSQIAVLPVVNRENSLLGIIRVHDVIRSGL